MFITWFELSRVKLYRNDLKGNENYFELAGVSLHYSKCEQEIQSTHGPTIVIHCS